jgi:hypothetical protein
MTTQEMSYLAAAERVAAGAMAAVMADLGRARSGVVVDSPPGAGKTALVVHAATELAAVGERVMVVAQTNGQVDDLTDRLATAAGDLAIGRLSRADYVPTPLVKRHDSVGVAARIGDLGNCQVLVGTAAKWAAVGTGIWPWAVIDEAYQMRSDLLARIASRFDGALFVGDPGQLDPFSTVAVDRWTGLTWDPMQSAVPVLLRNNPGLPVRRLPVSWRLPASAVPAVAEAFYPFTGFLAGTSWDQRRLEFATTALGSGAVDEAIETAAAAGWALYELPARQTVRTDGEAAAACTELAERILQRGTIAYSELSPSGRPVTADRIAIGTAHRDQAQAIRARLGPLSAAGVVVDTASRLQGREFDLMIVLHPLSGRRDAAAFHLEAGRLCVLTSRHRHACIVVARAGLPALLDARPPAEPVYINAPVKFPDGWKANQVMMTHLARFAVRAR